MTRIIRGAFQGAYKKSYGRAVVLSSKVQFVVEMRTLPSRPHGAAPFQSVVPTSFVAAIVKVMVIPHAVAGSQGNGRGEPDGSL